MRIGIGFDAHRFGEGRRLVLGGVEIADSSGLSGHSDADVLSHAIADALLGAARLGDLGTHFPGDERWSGASSLEILREVAMMVRRAGLDVVNVDATLVAEHPRLSPQHDEMAANIAAALSIDASDISIKATTADGMGFTGRGEGMAAVAVALVEESEASSPPVDSD